MSCSCVTASNTACPPTVSGIASERGLELRADRRPTRRASSSIGTSRRASTCAAVHGSVATPSRRPSRDVGGHADEVREHVAHPPLRRGRCDLPPARRAAACSHDGGRALAHAAVRRGFTFRHRAPPSFAGPCETTTTASTIAQTEPASSTAVIEVTFSTQPATSTPSGTVPPKPMIHSAITRPRVLLVEIVLEHRRQRRDHDEVHVAEQRARPGTRAPVLATARRPRARPRTRRSPGAAASIFERCANTVPTVIAPSAAPSPKHAYRTP